MLLATLLCLLAPSGSTVALAGAAASFPAWPQPLERCRCGVRLPEPAQGLLGLAYLCGCLLPPPSEASRISFKNSCELFMRRIFRAQSGGRAARYSLEFAGSVAE